MLLSRSLGEIAESIDYGVTASAASEPVGPKFLRITDIQDGMVDWDRVPWCVCDSRSAQASLLRSGDIVFARTGGTTGKSFLIAECPADAVFASYLIRVRFASGVEPRYVNHYFQSPSYWAQISRGARGAAQPGVNATTLKSLQIPLPPLEDQKRIAHLLGKVEGLIAQRKQHLQQLDALLKSVFLEMFGDPIINPKQFRIRRLSEFYINPKEGTKCGPFGSALKKDEVVDSGVPVWNMDNIGPSGQMIMPFRMWVTKEKYEELSAYEVLDGDIVISRAGTVGKMCVARMNGSPAIISTNLIRVRLGPELLPLHFVSLMLYCKGRVGRLKTGADGTFTHMNTGVLDSLEFPYPPIDLQNQFAAIVEKVVGIKSHYQQSLAALEALYGTLSQKAFAGELDLSRVELPLEEEKFMHVDAPEIRASATPAFAVPPIPEGTNLGDKAQRQALIEEWLEAYLQHLQVGQDVSINDFVDTVNSAFQSQEDVTSWGTADQDLLRERIFQALEASRLEQTSIPGSDKKWGRLITLTKGALGA